MFQREGKRGERLAAAGGYGEAEKSWRKRRLGHSMVENVGAQCVERRQPRARAGGYHSGHIGAQPIAQHGKVRVLATLHLVAGRPRVIILGGDEIGIDEAGEQHPDKKALHKAFGACLAGSHAWLQHRRLGQRTGMFLPAVRHQPRSGFHAPVQIRAIRQSRMMGRDNGGEDRAESLPVAIQRDPRPGGGVIAARREITTNIALEFARSLADVMQMSRKAQKLHTSQRRGKLSRKRTYGGAMIRKGFPQFLGSITQGVGVNADHELSGGSRSSKDGHLSCTPCRRQ
ncbi:hypothetical protein V5F77_22690 [Xanthobacter sp. DSM 24535]